MAPVRILIVEDERIVGSDLRRRLGRMGHTVVGITASGEEAIAHAHRLQPDLVLMDVRLRGPMDGIEAAQHIWIQCRILVVFMSGYTTVETLERIGGRCRRAISRNRFLTINSAWLWSGRWRPAWL